MNSLSSPFFTSHYSRHQRKNGVFADKSTADYREAAMFLFLCLKIVRDIGMWNFYFSTTCGALLILFFIFHLLLHVYADRTYIIVKHKTQGLKPTVCYDVKIIMKYRFWGFWSIIIIIICRYFSASSVLSSSSF